MAVSELASISERRDERLVNPALSDGLPAFLTPDGGLNSGFMIPQYVAASLVSARTRRSAIRRASTRSRRAPARRITSRWATRPASRPGRCSRTPSASLAIELLAGAQAVEFHAPLEPGVGARRRTELVRDAVAAAARRPAARRRHRAAWRPRSATARSSRRSRPRPASSHEAADGNRAATGRCRVGRTATARSSTRALAAHRAP